MNQQFIILASASPRRAELLAQIGVVFKQHAADIDETRRSHESPEDYVMRMSAEKCQVLVNKWDDCVVLGSDTIVLVDEEVLGKPAGQHDHAQMLTQLSDCTHKVLTSVTMMNNTRQATRLSSSQVKFRELSSHEIAHYWHTGEPQDKAGGYAIQGLGAVFVEQLTGSYSGVMGLPLYETAELLNQFGIDPLKAVNHTL